MSERAVCLHLFRRLALALVPVGNDYNCEDGSCEPQGPDQVTVQDEDCAVRLDLRHCCEGRVGEVGCNLRLLSLTRESLNHGLGHYHRGWAPVLGRCEGNDGVATLGDGLSMFPVDTVCNCTCCISLGCIAPRVQLGDGGAEAIDSADVISGICS